MANLPWEGWHYFPVSILWAWSPKTISQLTQYVLKCEIKCGLQTPANSPPQKTLGCQDWTPIEGHQQPWKWIMWALPISHEDLISVAWKIVGLILSFKVVSLPFLIQRLSVTQQISSPTKAANNKIVKKTRNKMPTKPTYKIKKAGSETCVLSTNLRDRSAMAGKSSLLTNCWKN